MFHYLVAAAASAARQTLYARLVDRHDANHFRLRHQLGDVPHDGVGRGAGQAGRRLVEKKHLRLCSVSEVTKVQPKGTGRCRMAIKSGGERGREGGAEERGGGEDRAGRKEK